MLLPFQQPKAAGNGNIVFAGDIGATKTNLAMYRVENGKYRLLQEAKLVSKDYNNIAELTGEFTRDTPEPDAICFGVAGPVLNGHATLSNLQWEIDIKEITAQYKTAKVHLINDLKATAYGLAVLDEKDTAVVHKGNSAVGGNAAIIAPGTGLGEAGLYWDSQYYHPFATEGGHADFAARSSFDFELYTYLQQQFEHVSWERLVCGPGIVNIYRFLRDEMKMEEPGWLKEKMANADKAATISENAEQCLICEETMRCFMRYLAYECANLVLKLNATGGLFIGGGIAPQIVRLFEHDAFYTSFRQKGRLNFLLEKVPVKIILNNKTALLGAAYYAATR
ncbi:glucokinase [Agriterribacter sp.]|uniref:glucokinase n=1 Tax=Agriterribacter sp. TaxID=2821509 RepID=UPI002CAFFC55|nr:glucokinase [Agriterribacter sp.]HRP57821.1 glucokinase [Agriterribacter sp.]